MSTVPGVYGVIGLRVPGALAYRHLAIRLVSTACKMALDALASDASCPQASGFSAADFEAEVVCAFGEAFNNIALHGFRGRTPEPVQIEVDWDDEKLVITCVDNGHTFNPDDVAAPDLDELPEHGMGLFIIKSAMDEVDYHPGPPNVLRLTKRHAGRLRRDALLPGVQDHDGGGPRPPPNPPDHLDRADALADGDRGSGVEFIAPVGESCIVETVGRRPDDRMAESSRRR